MKSIAVIGGGISGLSIAQCLKDKFRVKVYEGASKPGGLIKCERIDGNLYHMVGGHVFNSKRQDVLDWFWNFFDREEEFTKATRNAIVDMGKPIGYPIENHIYQFDPESQKQIINDLLEIAKNKNNEPTNFEEFLKFRFGETLYNVYFKPYNEKVWKRDLSQVPLSWLAGKLPMPTAEEIIFNNFNKESEMNMVHSTFYYAKNNGSQFLVDRLAQGLNITYNSKIQKLEKIEEKWMVNGAQYDLIIFCGNIKDLPEMTEELVDISVYKNAIVELEYHGTTSVLCEIEKNDFSWVYMPDHIHNAHRIICTGNFSVTNNGNEALSATIEFTDEVNKETILENLERIPYSPKYLTHRYTPFTYPIQNGSTREVVNRIKELTEVEGLYLLGRFAEWEYYNMDSAIGAAIDLSKRIYGIQV
jgi:protoporphyrinogen oxidase